MDRRLLIPGALLLSLCGCPDSSSVPPAPAPEPAAPTPAQPWPPNLGQPYPSLYLFDSEGKPQALGNFKGQPVLVHLIDAESSESVGLAGGEFGDPFAEVEAAVGALAIEERLSAAEVDLTSSELLIVHVLLLAGEAAPDVDLLKAWSTHFEPDPGPNTRILFGDSRYLDSATRELTPGLHVINADSLLINTASAADAKALDAVIGDAAKLAKGLTVEVPVPTVEGPWPPSATGQLYPNLWLQDLDGKPVRLRSLAGKPLLIQLVGTQSPGNIGYTGGEDAAPFHGMPPDKGQPSIDRMLANSGLPEDDPRLQRVHLLIFESMSTAPTLELCREWAKHFELGKHDNTHVFLADARYMNPATLPSVPGYHLVNADFVLVSNGTRGHDDLYKHTLRKALRLGGARKARSSPTFATDVYPEDLPPRRSVELHELLAAGRFRELDAALEARVATRRAPGSYEDDLSYALRDLSSNSPEALKSWVRARPESFFARIVLGSRYVDAAWDARGGGFSNTVTEEGWAGFRKNLALARGEFRQATQFRDDLPYGYSWQLIVDRGESVDTPSMLRTFAAAHKADPLYIPAYVGALGYLQPRWHGSLRELRLFSEQARAASPNEPAMNVVEYKALTMEMSDRVLRKEAKSKRSFARNRPKFYAKLVRLVKAAHEAYPRSPELLKELIWLSQVPKDQDGELWLAGVRGLAELGSAVEIRRLGLAHNSGWFGIKRDSKKGCELLLRAAQLGDGKAAGLVGRVYLYTARERPTAVKAARAWLERGVSLNDPSSFSGLAGMLLDGKGGPSEAERAKNLLQRGAKLGDKESEERLAALR